MTEEELQRELQRKGFIVDSSGDLRPIPDPTVLTDQLVTKAIRAVTETFDAKLNALADKADTLDRFNTRHTDLAVAQFRELMEARIASLIEADSNSMIQRELLVHQITESQEQLSHLFEQRIASLTETVAVLKTTVNERFTQGDVQTEKAARDVKSAVDAAFAAAKEAVGEQNKSNALSIAKSEVATTKQIDQLSENLRISVKNTDDKIDGIKNNFDDKYTDLKDRVVAMEARGSVNDPSTVIALKELNGNVSNLRTSRDAGEGRSKGTSEIIGWAVGIGGLVVALMVAFMHTGPFAHS